MSENSSPTPMQRRGVVNSRPAYGFHPRFARNSVRQVGFDQDEITEYDDREAIGRLPPQFQASAHVAAPSNYRSPSFDRYSCGTQSGKDGPASPALPGFYACMQYLGLHFASQASSWSQRCSPPTSVFRICRPRDIDCRTLPDTQAMTHCRRTEEPTRATFTGSVCGQCPSYVSPVVL